MINGLETHAARAMYRNEIFFLFFFLKLQIRNSEWVVVVTCQFHLAYVARMLSVFGGGKVCESPKLYLVAVASIRYPFCCFNFFSNAWGKNKNKNR
jgi:hypothetical protein